MMEKGKRRRVVCAQAIEVVTNMYGKVLMMRRRKAKLAMLLVVVWL